MAALAAAAVGATAAVGSAYTSAEAAKAQGAYQKRQAELNAGMGEFQAEEAIRRGDEDAKAMGKKTKQVIGSQRAALAAQGIEVDSGTAAEIQADTAAIGAVDAQTIKNNAWREAWGFRAQATVTRGQGNMALMAANNQAKSTLITGGLQALSAGTQGFANRK
jgi:hypothetical protein